MKHLALRARSVRNSKNPFTATGLGDRIHSLTLAWAYHKAHNTPDKKAHIYIITSREEVELKWLNKALEFFDKTKIKYM